MRKRILFTLTIILFSISLSAQNYHRAIGLRLGSSVGFSYREFVAPTHSIEGILDLNIIHKDFLSLNATGIYQFNFHLNEPGLSLYAGPGASLGFLIGNSDKKDNHNGVFISIDGMLGIEYAFRNAPIALSLDWNPKVRIINHTGFSFDNFALTIRYIIK